MAKAVMTKVDLGAELLASVREMKTGKRARTHVPDLSDTLQECMWREGDRLMALRHAGTRPSFPPWTPRRRRTR